MRCPFCNHDDTQVKDSRPTDDGSAIRRRRQCPNCNARFTTFERVQLREIMVIKNNGSREPFDRDKLLRSLRLCLRKRPVSDERIEQVASSLARQVETLGESEVTSRQVGALVMEVLVDLDDVAFVRYASVYKDFREAKDYNEFIRQLQARAQRE